LSLICGKGNTSIQLEWGHDSCNLVGAKLSGRHSSGDGKEEEVISGRWGRTRFSWAEALPLHSISALGLTTLLLYERPRRTLKWIRCRRWSERRQ
jgi:hypothetical protein